MVKITSSSSARSEKQKELRPAVWRLMLAALLVSAIISTALPGSRRAEAQSKPSYTIATISAGASPSAAKVGDLDGDKLNDIAVVNIQGDLQLFFNKGSGSFDRVSLNGLWPSTSKTLDVAIGDLNGDGRADIAIAFSTQSGAVSVLLNQGNRVFSAPVNYNSCSSSHGVAIADLDGDGDNDLAEISQCSKAGVLLNNGQGGFAFAGVYGTGADATSIALGDFNRDGSKDIAYVNNGVGASGNVTVVLNNGNGTFGSPIWLYAGDLPDDLTTGDFNGDGNIDLAIANSYYSQTIMLFGSGNGAFDAGYSELGGFDTPTGIASADFNGDGRLDYAVISWGTNTLAVFTNQDGYNFARVGPFNTGQSPVDVETGNLDGDSLPDLVTVNQASGTLTVLFSESVSSPPPPPPPPPSISLTLSTRVTSKARFVDLKWSGATGSKVDIYRDGLRTATVSNTGSYSDQFDRRATGTRRYKVCVSGAQTCSKEATISF